MLEWQDAGDAVDRWLMTNAPTDPVEVSLVDLKYALRSQGLTCFIKRDREGFYRLTVYRLSQSRRCVAWLRFASNVTEFEICWNSELISSEGLRPLVIYRPEVVALGGEAHCSSNLCELLGFGLESKPLPEEVASRVAW